MSVLIGPLGDLRQVRCTVAPAQVTHDAQAARVKALDGTRYVQFPPSDRRAWQWDLVWASAEELRWLVELEQGVHGDALYFYEPIAAQLNMLGPGAATPGIEPGTGGWTKHPVPASSLSVPERGVIQTSGNGGHSPTVPVAPGRTYAASIENVGTVDQDAAVITYDTTGAVIETMSLLPSPTPPGQRATATVTTPAVDVLAARIALQPSGTDEARWTRPQLTETSGAVPWQPGVGIPRVVLSGVAEAYRSTSFATRRDHSVTIIEVG
ncbi:hypothetical protein CLV30_12816 [Haloactinopolyspora alba]|uniref:Uncharacterized protein n=1 Tax=Haloactinopolyspora alba TaxID=648780 RepID=A0A2P8DEW6_9ACTN|nr:hypothetical protein [Haloactinopolyspora alba]PSK95764.1 hypothetical protein CLV30_12816 [Haloactinopolyspora alba]